jgi:uncharacterized protein (TIGR02646 family)
MRYVDPDKVEELLPPDWEDGVGHAKDYVARKVVSARQKAESEGKPPEEVANAVHRARSIAINEKSDIWRYFAGKVEGLSYQKCWYCESIEDRSHMPIDHFRPKGAVIECEDHDGYWWLAFDWRNYRYCCTFCNSHTSSEDSIGGKQNHFPLLNPPNWIRDQTGDLSSEQPLLLDPCDPDDPMQVTFHENGFPREVNQDRQSVAYRRANTSIGLYHLHHGKAVISRKRIAIKIRNLVEEIDNLRAAHQEGVTNVVQIKNRMKDLTKLVREDAAYRTAARLYLKGNINEGNQHWVQALLDRN